MEIARTGEEIPTERREHGRPSADPPVRRAAVIVFAMVVASTLLVLGIARSPDRSELGRRSPSSPGGGTPRAAPREEDRHSPTDLVSVTRSGSRKLAGSSRPSGSPARSFPPSRARLGEVAPPPSGDVGRIRLRRRTRSRGNCDATDRIRKENEFLGPYLRAGGAHCKSRAREDPQRLRPVARNEWKRSTRG